MAIKFSPVPAEDRERGRNSNCYNHGSPLTEAMKEQFMEEIKPICIEMERKYGVPAAFLGGQAVNESGFGLTRTGYFANNFCGLKFVGAWGRKPPQIMNGQDFGVETYQLIGQPDETDEKSVPIIENLGEDRLIFDESGRYDNRYFKFKNKPEFFDFLCRIAYLNGSEGRLYPKDLREIFNEYQQNIQRGMSIKESCSLVACRLGESGYCHVEEGEGSSDQRRCNYYSRVITEAMDEWNTYEWTKIALTRNGGHNMIFKDEDVTWLKNFTNEKEDTVIVGYIGDKPVASLISNLKEDQIKFAQRFSNAKTWRTAKSQEKPPYINPSRPEPTLPIPAVERMRTKFAEALKTSRYMEQQCQPTTYPNWEGFPLKECLYQVTDQNGTQKSAKVIMLNPSAEQLARWVVATCLIVKGNADQQYTNQLFEQIIGQSGAQFPVAGIVFEDMEGDGVNKIYCFREGVTVRVKDIDNGSTHQPTDAEIEKSLYGEIDKTWTGQYARLQGTTREQYKANGGKVDVGDQNNRKLSWLDVSRELYQTAWGKDRNELMIAWAHSNL